MQCAVVLLQSVLSQITISLQITRAVALHCGRVADHLVAVDRLAADPRFCCSVMQPCCRSSCRRSHCGCRSHFCCSLVADSLFADSDTPTIGHLVIGKLVTGPPSYRLLTRWEFANFPMTRWSMVGVSLRSQVLLQCVVVSLQITSAGSWWRLAYGL